MLQVACSVFNDEGQGIPPPRIPKFASSASTGASEPLFKSGDFVELLVEEDVSFNGVFQVRAGGYVLIPKVGRVEVVGLNRDAAEKRIRESLQKQQLKTATVFVEHTPGPPRSNTILETTSFEPSVTIFLTGAVARPGQHRIHLQSDGGTPGVFETLLIAGGLAKFGDDTKIRIMRLNERGMRNSILVDARKIRDGLSSDVPIGDGDIIQVPEKVFGF